MDDDPPNDDRRYAQRFWDSPLKWIFLRVIGFVFTSSPFALVVYLVKFTPDFNFSFDAWYLYLLGAGLLTIPIAGALTIYSESAENISAFSYLSDSLSGRYALDYMKRSFVGLIIISSASLLYYFWMNDFTPIVGVGVYLFIVVGYFYAIIIRMKKKWFGLNAVEAEEVLDFFSLRMMCPEGEGLPLSD